MNTLLNAMKAQNAQALTENGGRTYNTTMNGLMDLFALGAAYRTRSDADCILLFKKALEEDETLALKCLFYLRDCRGGQGERRFFRVVIKWLANNHPEMIKRNFEQIPIMGRWDDFYTFVDTPLEKEAFNFMYHAVAEGLDICKALPNE